MSQVNVERVIGLLATDEGLRRRFMRNPHSALQELSERGLELSLCERWSLSNMDTQQLARFAEALGPRLQKADLSGGAKWEK